MIHQNINANLETFTGVVFNTVDPMPSDVRIEDIAHGLSLLCRFGGQCSTFYSVAQHSIRVADSLHHHPHPTPLLGLLHDAQEAYLCDLPRPIKAQLPDYSEMEHRIQEAIMSCFGLSLSFEDQERIARADEQELYNEARQFMRSRGDTWKFRYPCREHDRIHPLGPGECEKAFLERFERYSA